MNRGRFRIHRGARALVGGLVLSALAGLSSACSGDAPGVPADQAVSDTGGGAPPHDMAAMAPAAAAPHDMAAMTPAASAPPDMAGMDHSGMTEQAPAGAAAAPTGNHSGMAGMRSPGTGGAAPTDHSAMPGMGARTEPAASADQTTTEKLLKLAALLVRDAGVQQRIQADSALRSGWQDGLVRG